MNEEIVRQRIILECVAGQLAQEKSKLDSLIQSFQSDCLHADKELILEDIKGGSRAFDKHLVLKGWKCKTCELFLPSKVWNKRCPSLPHSSKYCEQCDSEILEYEGRSGFSCTSDRENHYKCRKCGHRQSVWLG